MKDIKFYLDIIGLKNTKDLDRFLKEEAYEGEKVGHCLRRYVAYLRRWGLVKSK